MMTKTHGNKIMRPSTTHFINDYDYEMQVFALMPSVQTLKGLLMQRHHHEMKDLTFEPSLQKIGP